MKKWLELDLMTLKKKWNKDEINKKQMTNVIMTEMLYEYKHNL